MSDSAGPSTRTGRVIGEGRRNSTSSSNDSPRPRRLPLPPLDSGDEREPHTTITESTQTSPAQNENTILNDGMSTEATVNVVAQVQSTIETSLTKTPAPVVRAPLVAAWGTPASNAFNAATNGAPLVPAGAFGATLGVGASTGVSAFMGGTPNAGHNFGAFGASALPGARLTGTVGVFGGAIGGIGMGMGMGMGTGGGSLGVYGSVSGPSGAGASPSVGQPQLPSNAGPSEGSPPRSEFSATLPQGSTSIDAQATVSMQSHPESNTGPFVSTSSDSLFTPTPSPTITNTSRPDNAQDQSAVINVPTSTAPLEKSRKRKGKEPAKTSSSPGPGSSTTAKPRTKRGDWRVAGYTNSNNAAIAPTSSEQPPTNGPYNSAFRASKTSYGPIESATGDDIEARREVSKNKGKDKATRPPASTREPSDYRRQHTLSQEEAQAQRTIDLTCDYEIYDAPPARGHQHLSSYDEMTEMEAHHTERTSRHSQTRALPYQHEREHVTNILITVFIDDIRGQSEPQLAELRLPVERRSGCYWVDAVHVCEALQNGPSRIDGPASAFTYRGKYRQKFLRVTADNEDLFESANLLVNEDRTLEIFVEEIQMPSRHSRSYVRSPPLSRHHTAPEPYTSHSTPFAPPPPPHHPDSGSNTPSFAFRNITPTPTDVSRSGSSRNTSAKSSFVNIEPDREREPERRSRKDRPGRQGPESDHEMEEDNSTFSRTRRPDGFQPAPPVEYVQTGVSWVAKLTAANKEGEQKKKRTQGRGSEGSKGTSRKRQKTSVMGTGS